MYVKGGFETRPYAGPNSELRTPNSALCPFTA